jgi:hypothetical protein
LPASFPPYPWPVEPFDAQHPVRGFFHDPRIGDHGGSSFHTGVDVSAPDGTAVHAVTAGRVTIEGAQIVAVVSAGRDFGYWHVIPAVKQGQHVEVHDLIGHIGKGWGHVHLAERTASPGPHGSYWNPLRRGGMTPFEDFGAPVITEIETSMPAGALLGHVDFSVQAFDRTPVAVPPPWDGIPVTPALLRWRLVHNSKAVVPWQVAMDARVSFTPNVVRNSDVNFRHVYAPRTRQNHPEKPGLFRFWLVRGFDTRQLPDARYRLEVEVSDVRGNKSRKHLIVAVVNEHPPV